MRNFINNFYRFSGLNEEQKSNFANYFMNINKRKIPCLNEKCDGLLYKNEWEQINKMITIIIKEDKVCQV